MKVGRTSTSRTLRSTHRLQGSARRDFYPDFVDKAAVLVVSPLCGTTRYPTATNARPGSRCRPSSSR